MNSNNKKRLLELINILKQKSDINHPLSLNKIVEYLDDKGIVINDRKTLYDDFKVLSEYGYEIEYNHGYYLTEAPFLLSEIKIIIDSINSLKNLDNKLLDRLKNKLYSYVSIYEKDLLKDLEYFSSHSDKKFINRMEDVLESIRANNTLIIKRKDKTEDEEIVPLFLFRNNDYYYLYYHYLGSNKIYHTRFDNIVSSKLTNHSDDISINKANIISNIEESSNAFYSKKAQLIKIKIVNDSEYLRNRLNDDFKNIVYTKDGFTIKASINNAFYAKLVSYYKDIKIMDKAIAKEYTNYLKDIINQNK